MTSLRGRTGWRWRIGGLALAVVLVAGALELSGVWDEDRPAAPVESWRDGEVHGPWRSVFHGYGSNVGGADELTLTPRAARRKDRTHACLVVSTARYERLDYSVRMRTVEQLRTPDPNPWEVAWLVWAYTDPEHFYYLALKPNGWELGKRDPAYRGGQRFLATGTSSFPVGEWSEVRARQDGPRMTVSVDDRQVVAFTDRERPYPAGSVGAYTEDARVEFRDIAARPGSVRTTATASGASSTVPSVFAPETRSIPSAASAGRGTRTVSVPEWLRRKRNSASSPVRRVTSTWAGAWSRSGATPAAATASSRVSRSASASSRVPM